MAQSIPQAIPARTRTPKSKEDVLDALMLTVPEAQVKRVKNHVAEVFFPDTGATFLLTIHKPRGPKAETSTAKEAAAGRAKSARGASKRRSSRARH
jgi:hypothetical protein